MFRMRQFVRTVRTPLMHSQALRHSPATSPHSDNPALLPELPPAPNRAASSTPPSSFAVLASGSAAASHSATLEYQDIELDDQVFVRALRVLRDNFVFFVRDRVHNETMAVDPGDGEMVLQALGEWGWRLHCILNTHFHVDHTGGNQVVATATKCEVVAAEEERARIPAVTRGVQVGGEAQLPSGGVRARVLSVPGHTRHDIAFWLEKQRAVFVGDALFSLGCGRVFEGTPAQLSASLQQLMALPLDTRIFFGHEYTASNARFALTVEPKNEALQRCAEAAAQCARQGRFTVPSTVATEKAANPFVRVGDAQAGPIIRAAMGLPAAATDDTTFAELRRRKDIFS